MGSVRFSPIAVARMSRFDKLSDFAHCSLELRRAAHSSRRRSAYYARPRLARIVVGWPILKLGGGKASKSLGSFYRERLSIRGESQKA